MRILFLTDNYPPEVNAPANRTFEHCREWQRAGHEVTVITCVPNFPKGEIFKGYRNRLFQRTTDNGITVIRVWSYISANEGFLLRTLDYLSYAISASIAGLFVRADIIVATSPQFFTAVAGGFLGFLKRTPWVFEVRDLWPESIKAVGAMQDSLAIRALEWLEVKLYRAAARIVVVTDSFKARLTERGIPGEKCSIVKNGVLLDAFSPLPRDTELAKELGLEGKFIVSYIGTIGLAHAIDFVIRAAHSIATEHPDFHFLIIGEGAGKADAEAVMGELSPRNVTLLDQVERAEVKRYISLSDAALVNLKRSETFLTVLPSKIFENAAMQKPVLLGVEGEAKALVEKYGAGISFIPENRSSFVAALRRLKDEPDLAERCRAGAKRLAEDFDRRRLAMAMLAVLEEVAATGR